MSIGEKLRGLKGLKIPLFSRRNAADSDQAPQIRPEFAAVRDIALKAWHIPFDNKRGDKQARSLAAARNLVEHLSPVVADEALYEVVDGVGHSRILELLKALIPADAQGREEFIQGPVHGTIVSYVGNLVAHRVAFPDRAIDPTADNYPGAVSTYLERRIGLPYAYLSAITEHVGLPALPPRFSLLDR